MKQVLITSVLLFFFISASAQFKVGAGASLNFDGAFFGVTGKGHYTINEDFAGQGSFTYYFENTTVWSLDFDTHYSGFDIEVAEFAISPFAGLNVFRIGSASSTNINLGVNATKALGSLELFIEPKIILGGGSSLNISGGVYF